MKKLKHIQNGGITILLVILVGLGVMAGVGSLANSVGSKKETGIAAHAQSNAQMLAWIGTNAFYEYLKTQGLKGINVFKGMDGKDVPLKSTGLHTIKAKNVKIDGDCTADGDVCEVSANISASSMASQAANTIHVLYRMNVSGGLVKPESKLQATFSGATDIFGKIYAEKAGAEAEITVKGGDLYIGSMARINDFSKVTFNVEGNVRINCEQSKCTRVQQMDINATGWIEITDTISANADFGNLSAKKWIKGSYLRALNLSAGEFVELRFGSKVENINAAGYVLLESGSSAGDIRTNDKVTISASTVKKIYAKKSVSLNTGARSGDIEAADAVQLNGGAGALRSVAGKITSNENVNISWSTAGDICTKKNLEVIDYGDVNNVLAQNVTFRTISGTEARGNILATGNVEARYAKIKNITANGYIKLGSSTLDTGSKANGDLYAGQYIQMWSGSQANNVTSSEKVSLSANLSAGTGADVLGTIRSGSGGVEAYYNSTMVGDMYSSGPVVVGHQPVVLSGPHSIKNGNIYAKGAVKIAASGNVGNIFSKTSVEVREGTPPYSGAGDMCAPEKSDITTTLLAKVGNKKSEKKNECSFAVPATPTQPTVNPCPGVATEVLTAAELQAMRDAIDGKFDTETHVDARAYKGDANYIFTKENGVDRVFLNYLKNPADGTIYWYKKGPSDTKFKQYYETAAGVKGIVGDGKGFYIGKYTLDGSARVGAICQTRDSSNKYCTSEIISFIPRVGDRDRALGTAFETLFHDSISNIWYIKNLEHDSSIDNATIAPGIFYFEGKLEVHGRAELESGPSSNVYTNSFLAEGSIEAVTTSPRIYSPYNILRVKPNAAIICDRKFGNVNKTIYGSPPATIPSTQGNKFLIPINLCQDATNFKYNMDLDPVTGDTQMVTIDGVQVPKLDLGHVAIMSNMNVRIGTCSQIFGDVLARGRLETTGSCGITDEKQKVVGMVTTQNASDNLGLHNSLNADTSLYLPDRAQTGDPKHSGSGGLLIDTSSVEMIWAKSM